MVLQKKQVAWFKVQEIELYKWEPFWEMQPSTAANVGYKFEDSPVGSGLFGQEIS